MLKDGDGALLAEDIIDGRIEEKCKGKYALGRNFKKQCFFGLFLVYVWSAKAACKSMKWYKLLRQNYINNVPKMA